MERWLFVCMGNICRSPTLEGVMRERIERWKLSDRLSVDSAGLGDWHVGKQPDPRTRAAARRRGYDLDPLRARQVKQNDFHEFDLILASDLDNLAGLQRLCPPDQQHKLAMVLSVLPAGPREVPDPYFGAGDGFETVLDLAEAACDAWLAKRFLSGA